jgi:hypothetical protein
MLPSDTGLAADKRPADNEFREHAFHREHQDDSTLRGRPTNSEYKGVENPNKYLQTPLSRSSRTLSPDALSILSTDEYEQLQPSRSLTFSAPEDGQSSESSIGWRARVAAAWIRNKGLAYMLLAQVFGVLMNVTTRLLEIEGNKGEGLHPFQILFARMSITVVLASAYMWYKKTPHFPLGKPEVRWLLAARGFGGFFGECLRMTQYHVESPTDILMTQASLGCITRCNTSHSQTAQSLHSWLQVSYVGCARS